MKYLIKNTLMLNNFVHTEHFNLPFNTYTLILFSLLLHFHYFFMCPFWIVFNVVFKLTDASMCMAMAPSTGVWLDSEVYIHGEGNSIFDKSSISLWIN